MTGNPLELFRKFFGAVRAILWFWIQLIVDNTAVAGKDEETHRNPPRLARVTFFQRLTNFQWLEAY